LSQQKKPREHFAKRGGPISTATRPDQVLSVPEWAMLNNLSLHTAYRVLASPDAPVTVQLSENRVGITRRANLDWQESRVRKRAKRSAA
jgi:predicted DNA-binding transcriptional regulator AlpA